MAENPLPSNYVRTEGDGMESLEIVTLEPTSSGLNNTSVLLENLQLSEERVPPPQRTINLVAKPYISSSKNKPPFIESPLEKKSKFVPYEPYKAAVKPIVPLTKKKKKTFQEETSTLQENVNKHQACDCLCTKEGETPKTKDTQLQNEKAQLEMELKIQSQVNSELKKLLVASVGEDMEARVHFLTEDKAKLAEDIRLYVQRIAADYEEKEKLTIEADIWRSKFLASSVLIEELAKWKAVLYHHNEDLQSCIKQLLEEMNVIEQKALQSSRQLKALNTAFDPLGSCGPKSPEPTSGSVIDLVSMNLNLAENLSKRLLGTYTQAREETDVQTIPTVQMTTGQQNARSILTNRPTADCSMSDFTSTMTANQVSALARRSMNKSYFSCCPHCTGEIHLI